MIVNYVGRGRPASQLSRYDPVPIIMSLFMYMYHHAVAPSAYTFINERLIVTNCCYYQSLLITVFSSQVWNEQI